MNTIRLLSGFTTSTAGKALFVRLGLVEVTRYHYAGARDLTEEEQSELWQAACEDSLVHAYVRSGDYVEEWWSPFEQPRVDRLIFEQGHDFAHNMHAENIVEGPVLVCVWCNASQDAATMGGTRRRDPCPETPEGR